MFNKRALIVGVTGIAGINLPEYLLHSGGWHVSGVSLAYRS